MKLKILLVDDKIQFLDTAIQYLNMHPKVELLGWALSCSQAIEKVNNFNPDLILIDLSMPDISGFEFIKKLKSFNNTQKVIIMSLLDDKEYREEAEISGADGFISKKDFVNDFDALITTLFNQL